MGQEKRLTRAHGGGVFSALAITLGRILSDVWTIVLALFMFGLLFMFGQLFTGQYQTLAIVGGAWLAIAFVVAFGSK